MQTDAYSGRYPFFFYPVKIISEIPRELTEGLLTEFPDQTEITVVIIEDGQERTFTFTTSENSSRLIGAIGSAYRAMYAPRLIPCGEYCEIKKRVEVIDYAPSPIPTVRIQLKPMEEVA